MGNSAAGIRTNTSRSFATIKITSTKIVNRIIIMDAKIYVLT